MKKTIVSLLLVLTLVLSMFGGVSVAEEQTVLRIGTNSLPGTMDPASGTGANTNQFYFNIFDMILFNDSYNGFVVDSYVCESWERIDDLTMEFKLKEGITFHNGEPLTSEDIQYSVDRLINPAEGFKVGGTVKTMVANISHVEIIDDYTFRIVTKAPDAVLDARLASTSGIFIVPKDYIEEVGEEAYALCPISTGPYKIVETSPEKIVMEYYEGYYGEKPAFDRVEYIVYAENSTRASALIAGDIDIALGIPQDMVSMIESYDGLATGAVASTVLYMLRLNTTNEVLASKELRQALSLAIDRQAISDAFFASQASMVNGYNLEAYGDYYIEDYPYYEYNPEKAKELIAASGYNGEEIVYRLIDGYYVYGNETAEAIVSMWQEVGINARVEYNTEANWSMIHNWSNGFRFADPAGGLWALWGSLNDPEDKNATWLDMPQEFIDAGNTLSSSLSFEERYAANKTMLEIFDEEVPGIILFRLPDAWGMREGLNFTRGANRLISLRAEHFAIAE